jgi:hypothetical protein
MFLITKIESYTTKNGTEIFIEQYQIKDGARKLWRYGIVSGSGNKTLLDAGLKVRPNKKKLDRLY